jgi:RNA polymerase sigma-70 factor (ECF subfamily)
MSGKQRERVQFTGLQGRLDPESEAAEDKDTARLVAEFQAGDTEAFAGLYKRYFDRVYGYMRVAFKDRHEAEDVTQQAFTQIFEKLGSYQRRRQPFRAWLFTVVRNLAVSELRKRGRLEPMDPAELQVHQELISPPAEDDYALDVLNRITDPDLVIFIDRLPLAQRQVLALRYILDLRNPEIAEVLGRKPDEVKVLHYRAVTFLRARLAAIGRVPGKGERIPAQIRFKQNEVARHRRFMLHR